MSTSRTSIPIPRNTQRDQHDNENYAKFQSNRHFICFRPPQEQLNFTRCCVWIDNKKMFKFLFFVVLLSGLQSSQCFDDHINPVVFYDLKTRESLHPPTVKILPGSENESFNMSSVINIRLPFIGQPCKLRNFTEVFLKFLI